MQWFKRGFGEQVQDQGKIPRGDASSTLGFISMKLSNNLFKFSSLLILILVFPTLSAMAVL